MSDWPIHIVVLGDATAQGSHTAFNNKYTGKAQLVESNAKKLRPWRAKVSSDADEQYDGEALTGPLDVLIVFVVKRPKGHYGTGRNADLLKDSAPVYPEVRPDLGKLCRAIEDSLTGIVWRDDSLIVREAHMKRYGTKPRVEVFVRPTALATIGDLVGAGIEKPEVPEMIEFEQLSLA